MTYIVYTITNVVNGKIYVGKTNNTKKRWSKHLFIAAAGPTNQDYSVIHAAINKYGVSNFLFQEISFFEKEENALDAEVKLIAKLKSSNIILYNCTVGGDGISGYKHSKEMRELFSQQRTGRTLSSSCKKKISRSLKGKIRSKSHCESIKKHRTGTTCPEIVRIKNANRFRGEKSNTAKLSERDVIAVKLLLKKKISRSEIAKQFNVSKATITDIALGRTWGHVICD